MKDRDININISAGSVFKVVLVLILFVVLYALIDLVLVLLASVVLASAVEPATRWFAKYRVPRVAAVLFVYMAVATIVAGIFYLFIPPLFNEISNMVDILPAYLQSLTVSSTVPQADILDTGGIVGNLSQTFSLKEAVETLQSAVAGLSGGILQTVSSIFGGVFSLIMVIIISFYLAVQERGIENFLQIITPVKHEKYIVDLWKRSQEKIGKWMQGQLLLGLLIGILVYLGLTILGVEYAMTLALIAAVAELIPIFGPIIAAVPAILLGFMDSVTLGLMVAGFYIIIQQFENHLIYPLVVRKVVGVPPLLVILALIVGGKLAGLLGILLSVPVAAALMEFTDDIQEEKRKIHEHEDHKK